MPNFEKHEEQLPLAFCSASLDIDIVGDEFVMC